MATQIPWNQTTLYGARGEGEVSSANRLEQMAEFRRTDGIEGWFGPFGPDEDVAAIMADKDDDQSSAGLAPSEIDWTGFDAVLQADALAEGMQACETAIAEGATAEELAAPGRELADAGLINAMGRTWVLERAGAPAGADPDESWERYGLPWCAAYATGFRQLAAELVEVATARISCECGTVHGERCDWTGAASETVLVEWMPRDLRQSHEQARNSGTYPANGARHLRMARTCAADVVASDPDWASIL